MDDKLRRYIEGLFKDVPQTKSMVELKEEMLQNLIEKYQDLMNEGKTEEAAFNIAVAGIGDINELVNDLEKEKRAEDYDNSRSKSAMFTAIAVMLYILSLVPIMLAMGSALTFAAGMVGFFFMIALATGTLIFNGMTKPKPYLNGDTMVKEFREWQINRSKQRTTRISISVALWCVLIALYFIISFTTFSWHITWIIFIIGIAIEALINIYRASRK